MIYQAGHSSKRNEGFLAEGRSLGAFCPKGSYTMFSCLFLQISGFILTLYAACVKHAFLRQRILNF